MRPWPLILTACGAIFIASCSVLDPPRRTLAPTDNALPDTPRNVATHFDYGATPVAEMRATLTLEDGCLVAKQSLGEYAIPIWPSAYWLDGTTLMDGRRPVAEIGDAVRLIGGNYPRGQIPGELSNPIAETCPDVAAVFWVGGVDLPAHSSSPA